MKQIFTLLILGVSMTLGAQNLLTNGSFEDWTDGKPDGWFGDKTNFAASRVLESSDAQDGDKSLNLIREDSNHQRFTSQPINLEANTSYTLTYFVKGEGEVRNAFFNGNPDSTGNGYSTYSPYNSATSEWTELTYIFETGEDVTGVEIIFSVRNTSAEGILIDNVFLTAGGEIEVTEVANLGELRNSPVGSQIYQLTGEVLLTYKIDNRNQKYIQDETGAILIDDAAGRLSADYEVGDILTGITGTLTTYGDLLQFVPSESAPAAVSSGNDVNYEIITLSEYLADPVAFESRYIAISDLNISDSDDGDGTFQNGKNYSMTDGTDTVQGRTQFYDIGIIGEAIPTVPANVIGFGGRFNETIQFFLADVTTEALGVADLNTSEVVMTTVWTDNAHFVTKGQTSVEIYNLNGQMVQKANGFDKFNVNVSSLAKGVYIVKVTVDGKVSTHKVVKK